MAVELYGREVDRPGLVVRWQSTPQAWLALVAWSGLDGEVRVEWIHEAAYTVAELETWKHRQAASADGGTRISDEDVRSYQRLDDHERESLRTIARLAQRLSDNVHLAQDAIEEVRQAAERTRV